MDIDPVAIVTFIVRMVAIIFGIVIIGTFVSMANIQIKTDEFERNSVELAENIFSSQLTVSKYVFDPVQLATYNQLGSARMTELPFVRTCSYAYDVEITDLQNGNKWAFGYEPPSSKVITTELPKTELTKVGLPYVINNPSERTFFASIEKKDANRLANYYGNVDQAKVEITLYDTWLTRSTCLVEKAFTLKEKQEIVIPCIIAGGWERPCGFSLQRHPNDDNLACSFQRGVAGLGGVGDPKERDCRYFPPEIKFEPIDVTFSEAAKDLREKIVAYPIKEGATVPSCEEAKAGTGLAEKKDNVQTVLLCAEKIANK